MECAYLFDDDGTQMYCTICSGGEEVFMCDAENCAKVYCAPCIEKLCGLPELERVCIIGIIELVDSISRDGPDTPIHEVHYKRQNNSEQVKF